MLLNVCVQTNAGIFAAIVRIKSHVDNIQSVVYVSIFTIDSVNRHTTVGNRLAVEHIKVITSVAF